MNAFIVDLENRPGELARIAETIAQKGINIAAFSGATCGDSGSVALVTNDESGTRRALSDGSWKFRESELVIASLADRPGSLAEAARRLASASVNIDAALPVAMSGSNVSIAFATDNASKARTALAELAGAPAYSR